MKFLLTLLLIAVETSTAFVPARQLCGKASLFSATIADETKDVVDVLETIGATQEPSGTTQERSEALPFLLRPMNCKGYVGDVGFDPFYFSDRYPMEYLREAELKHGRLGTLAWFGWVAVDFGLRIYPAPLEEWQASSSAEAFKNLLPGNAIGGHPDGYWTSPLFQGLVIISFIEGYSTESVNQMSQGEECDREAGDVGFDVIKMLKGKTDEEVQRMKLRELKNVRLGMLAFFGVVVQSMVLGNESFPYVPKELLF